MANYLYFEKKAYLCSPKKRAIVPIACRVIIGLISPISPIAII